MSAASECERDVSRERVSNNKRRLTFARKVRDLCVREILGSSANPSEVQSNRAHQEPLHLQWRRAERAQEKQIDRRTDGWTGERHVPIPSCTKYLLKSLINLLLAGVDIPCEWAPR